MRWYANVECLLSVAGVRACVRAGVRACGPAGVRMCVLFARVYIACYLAKDDASLTLLSAAR